MTSNDARHIKTAYAMLTLSALHQYLMPAKAFANALVSFTLLPRVLLLRKLMLLLKLDFWTEASAPCVETWLLKRSLEGPVLPC